MVKGRIAALLARHDGPVAADVIEWTRLRAGLGSAAEVAAFLNRRPNWPGEPYLRAQSEAAFSTASDPNVLAFYRAHPPQTPQGVLDFTGALNRNGFSNEADARLALAWRTMSMTAADQTAFMASHGPALQPHHNARLDAMLWDGAHEDASRMLAWVPAPQAALARARIALRRMDNGVDAAIAALPASVAQDPGLAFERFIWRARKGRSEGAIDLLLARSKTAMDLGRPQEWASRRRTMARAEMRRGNAKRAYQIAAHHHLSSGNDYADLEWLAGFISLRKLGDAKTALAHFNNHDGAVTSPISKGRAGYWRGRAYEALGDISAADQAYTQAAQHQTSFYGLLATDRAGLPFDAAQATQRPQNDWRRAQFASDPLFQAGIILQASGELSLAERFWTHMAETFDQTDAALLGQAAVDIGQPHIAVMVGKRVAQRGIVIPSSYYPLHPVIDQTLSMAPEMVLSIARRESEFDPNVQSHVGARGLMQIMPKTGEGVAKRLGISAAHSTARLIDDPLYNGRLGAAYLSTLAGRFNGNVVMVSAGYNAGPSRVRRWSSGALPIDQWVDSLPFGETREYVQAVLAYTVIYRTRSGVATSLLSGVKITPFFSKVLKSFVVAKQVVTPPIVEQAL